MRINGLKEKYIMTLDAGGTNFVYGVWKDGMEFVAPRTFPSFGHDLQLCIKGMKDQFQDMLIEIGCQPEAISIAFPGPADYRNGIVGDLQNLPGFRGGISLVSILQEHFGIPVFIRNDGDLFALGEAMFGLLPYVNKYLAGKGNSMLASSLFGITLGSGIGGGMVVNNQLYTGNNFGASEIWQLRLFGADGANLESYCSKRGIADLYCNYSKTNSRLTPEEIALIADGHGDGDQEAAQMVFIELGKILGHAVQNIVTLLDCHIVFGGGISNAYHLFAPSMFSFLADKTYQHVVDWESACLNPDHADYINTNRPILFIGKSVMGTSKAIHAGAYQVVLQELS